MFIIPPFVLNSKDISLRKDVSEGPFGLITNANWRPESQIYQIIISLR